MVQDNSLLDLNNDPINRAIVKGLCDSVVDELKEILRAKAEEEIERVTYEVSKRLEVDLCSYLDFRTYGTTVQLKWLFNGVDQTKKNEPVDKFMEKFYNELKDI